MEFYSHEQLKQMSHEELRSHVRDYTAYLKEALAKRDALTSRIEYSLKRDHKAGKSKLTSLRKEAVKNKEECVMLDEYNQLVNYEFSIRDFQSTKFWSRRKRRKGWVQKRKPDGSCNRKIHTPPKYGGENPFRGVTLKNRDERQRRNDLLVLNGTLERS